MEIEGILRIAHLNISYIKGNCDETGWFFLVGGKASHISSMYFRKYKQHPYNSICLSPEPIVLFFNKSLSNSPTLNCI